MTTEDPLAIFLDNHLEDRDVADVIDAAYTCPYSRTRSCNSAPLESLKDAATFDLHAHATQTDIPKWRNNKPKNMLATSVRGGVMASLHRSVKGTHQVLSNVARFDAIGGKQTRLLQALEDTRCAEAWKKEIDDLMKNGNLVIEDIRNVPKGVKAIGFTAVFKHKYNPITKQYASTRARLAPHGFRQIAG